MTLTAPDKPRRGRPKKFVDLEMVERLAHIQCTHAEIASALGVSVDTLWRHKQFAEVYKRGAEGGRKSLRRMQFESANKGNVAMQIWLGKQYLAQSDYRVNEVRKLPPMRELSTEQLANLIATMTTEELREAIDAPPTTSAEYTIVNPGFGEKPPLLAGALGNDPDPDDD